MRRSEGRSRKEEAEAEAWVPVTKSDTRICKIPVAGVTGDSKVICSSCPRASRTRKKKMWKRWGLLAREPGYVEALRRDLARRRPVRVQDYDLGEVYFWNQGSVLEFKSSGIDGLDSEATVALIDDDHGVCVMG